MPSTGGRGRKSTVNGRLPKTRAHRGPWAAIELENDRLRVTLLPEKGCDILELIDRSTGIDVLFKAPWGSCS